MKALQTQLKRIFVKKIVKASRCEVVSELKKLKKTQGITISTKLELLEKAIKELKGVQDV